MIPNTLPPDFVASNPEALCLALNESYGVTSIRINPLKPFSHQHSDRVEWWDEGFYLPQRPIFTLDPAFAAGAYYVQEASSMFVGWLTERLELPDNPMVLDLCAAPGGKTTLLSSIVGQSGVVVANETIRARASILAQNVQKWGDGNTVVTSADAASFGNLGALFDLVLVDAPCSGEGMFRKDPAAREEWSVDNVAKCAARSRRIVGDVWDSLSQGGYMIYSTCTFNRHENEHNASWIVRELGGEIVNFDNIPDGIVRNEGGGYNFYPHMVRGEGFYACVVRKTSSSPLKAGKTNKITPKFGDRYTLRPMLYVEQSGSLYAYSTALYAMVEKLRSARIFMLYAGVELGVEIRGELKPAHSLALSPLVRPDLWPRASMELSQAIEYLRKGVVDASCLADGLNMICYDGLPLGFAKRIGARVNNMYPTAWRIANL